MSPSLETAILGEPSGRFAPTKRPTKPFFNQRPPLPRRAGPTGRAFFDTGWHSWASVLCGSHCLQEVLHPWTESRFTYIHQLAAGRGGRPAPFLSDFSFCSTLCPHTPGPHPHTTQVLRPTSDFSFRLCVQAGLLLHQLVPVPGRRWELPPRQHRSYPVHPHHLQLCQH